MMTVSREILMHPDFMADLADELCESLEALIDAEFEKGDEADFDFIDECANAINAIRSGDDAQILPIISRKDFLRKIGIKTERKFRVLIAACAAIALVFGAVSQIKTADNITIAHALSGIISEFFAGDNQEEITTTQPATTEKAAKITGIAVETADNFRNEYYVGEDFSTNGLRVYAVFDNGERKAVENYTVDIPENFGTKPCYETVEITFGNFTQSVEVRIIESLETKKLTSVYAVFPDDFDFTAKDLNNIDLSEMQVYAVYSNGDEKELSADEYTVTKELESSLFETYLVVTVEHENCSCSFVVYKE